MSNQSDNAWKNKKIVNDVRKGQLLNYSQYIYKKTFKFQNGGMNQPKSMRLCCSFKLGAYL